MTHIAASGDSDRTIAIAMTQTRRMKAARPENPIRALIVTCGVVGACLAAGYGVLFAMLDDIRDEYGISESALGVVIGIGFFAGFLAQVAIAPYADKGHARRLVLTGMVLNVVGLTMMAVATTIVPLLAGRFVTGIGIGMAVPALRRIVILADRANLGHNLGVLLAADVAGFAAGPAVAAALVGPFGIAAPVPRDGRGDVDRRPLRRSHEGRRNGRAGVATVRVRPAAHPTVRRCRRARLRRVPHDRGVRRALVGRARRPRHEPVDLEPRHHAVRACRW